MIQPAGHATTPAMCTTPHSAPLAKDKERPRISPSSNPRGPDSVEISYEYYAQRDLREKSSLKFIPPTEEELKSGGMYMKDENGNTYFRVAKNDYQEKGIQGLRESLNPGYIGSRMTEDVLTALEFLPGEKHEIAALIDTAASKAGLNKNDIKNLKIEVDAKGNIVVGGLRDKTKLQKVQKELNNVNGLAERIDNFKFLEKMMYENVKSLNVTPYQLVTDEDGNATGTINGMDYLEQLASQTNDIDSIEGLNDPLAYALLEYFKDPIETADFSHKASGVANPHGDMEKATSELKDLIGEKFLEYNRSLEGGPDSPDRITNRNIKIRIMESGAVEIEGKFSESAITNSHAESIVRDAIQKFMMPADDGTESLFTTALQRMTIMHDEEYGNDIGVEKEAVFEFSLGAQRTAAYVVDKNGEAEKAAQDAITQDIASFINEAAPESNVNKKSISVGEDGKISWNGPRNAIASEIVNQLNHAILVAKDGGTLDGAGKLNDLATGILEKLRSVNTYGPNAKKDFLHYKGTTQKAEEFAGQYAAWTEKQPHPYSTYKNESV